LRHTWPRDFIIHVAQIYVSPSKGILCQRYALNTRPAQGLVNWPVVSLALTPAVPKRRALLASRALVVPDFGSTVGTENCGLFVIVLLVKAFQELQRVLHISTISFHNQDVGHSLQSIHRHPWLAVAENDILPEICEITGLAHRMAALCLGYDFYEPAKPKKASYFGARALCL